MRALVYQGPKTMNILDVPDVFPKNNEVKIAPKYVGICGSDTHGYLGTTGRRIPPMVMGHEMSGIVLETGPGVSRCKPGDRVTVQPILYCGDCTYCRQGLVNICAKRRFLGTMDQNGVFADAICVEEKNVFLLPDSIGDLEGAMIEPLAVAFRAVSQAIPIEGKTVLICGAGAIGLLLLSVAKYFGAGKTAVVDLSSHRLNLAMQNGADIIINPAYQDIERELSKNGIRDSIDIAFEAVGVTPTVQQTVDYVRNKGTVVWVGNSSKMVTINMQNVVTRELLIKGTYVYTEKDFEEAICLLANSDMDIKRFISKVIPLEHATAAFEELCAGAGELIKVLVDMQA
jgi:2-desacetyl-2-hydroxyethyl bacteriochlorophyllide A dehydrogenase